MLYNWELTLRVNRSLSLLPVLRNIMLLKMQYELNFHSWSILVIKNGFLDPKLVGNDTQLYGFFLKVNQAIYMTFQGQ